MGEPFVSFSAKAGCWLMILSGLFTMCIHFMAVFFKKQKTKFRWSIFHSLLIMVIMHNNTFAGMFFFHPKAKSIAIISVFIRQIRSKASLISETHSNSIAYDVMVLSSVRFVCAHFPYGRFPRHRRINIPLHYHPYLSTSNRCVSCFKFAETNSNRITNFKRWMWIWAHIFEFIHSSSSSGTLHKRLMFLSIHSKSHFFDSRRPASTKTNQSMQFGSCL